MQEKQRLSKSQSSLTHVECGSIPMQEKLRQSKSQGASTPVELKRMQNVPYALAMGSIMYDTGYVFVLNEGVVDWKSTKQSIFTTSSAEAEYSVAHDACKEAVWVRKFISGLGVVSTIEEPINMYYDNTGAITIANESGITKGRERDSRTIAWPELTNGKEGRWRGKLIQKLLLNQKCMGYLVRAYYNIYSTRYYKDDSCWNADVKSKTTEDIISNRNFIEVLVLNHYVFVKNVLVLANITKSLRDAIGYEYGLSSSDGWTKSPVLWAEIRESRLIGPELVQETTDKGGVVRFEKKEKLVPRYVGPFEILERIGEVKIDKTLRFVKELMVVMDREVKSLKRSRISIVKVHWNLKQGHEDFIKTKYPHLVVEQAIVKKPKLGT
uniref:Tf2-1-like SH3-like domain-containing protein n=1 Tax=Tanacetum cinerariifolium TaxID=118510 RepID=A0A6L2MLD3_TANCI|nr:hypothetical protein [Tanacetum cinerariifolium]